MRPETLGPYQIQSQIGGGGMGVVYKATDTRLGRPVAVKFLQSRFIHDSEAKRRFVQEARAASAIDHPNICTIYEIDETDDGEFYLVMAYYQGETVAEKIRRGPLPLDDALGNLRQLLHGLARAHEAGIVHRDIKPGNLIVTPFGELKILDFGLAKLTGQGDPDGASGTLQGGTVQSGTLQGGTVQGTAAYMSPEQISGSAVDYRTDIWSAGVVFYEMLAGQHAFDGPNPAAILQKVLRGKPEPLTAVRPELPPKLEEITRRCLAKDPSFRYPSARELLEDLDGPPATFETAPPTMAFPTPGRPAPHRSILVLPFTGISPESDLEYFIDGLTDEVITDLSGIEALRVISLTSAMQLKGSTKSVPALSSELRVQYVLEGSVKVRDDQLRVTARLVDAPRDTNIWADRFTGTLEDIFEIQESISRRIVEALKVRLTPSEERKFAERRIRNPQAYEYYLRAKQQVLEYTEEALDRALQLLEQAERLEGENVLLLATRGSAYWQYVNGGISADTTLVDRARECAERILEIDSDSPHGHRLLGMVQITEGDPQEAVRNLKVSLARDPNDTHTLGWLVACYALVGRPAAGLPVAERLLRIDPLTPMYQCMPGLLAMMDGELERAFEPFQNALRMDASNPVVRLVYGQLLAFAHRTDEAVEICDRLAEDAEGTLFGQLARFYAGALLGEEDCAAVLDEGNQEVARRDPEYSWMVAECHALTGDAAEALSWLETAEQRGFINYPVLAEHDPLLANVRQTDGFREILARVKTRWEAFEV